LIYHHVKISKFTYEKLAQSLAVFTRTDWVSIDILQLFEKALSYCHGQSTKNAGVKDSDGNSQQS
jgi:hypothetical protein